MQPIKLSEISKSRKKVKSRRKQLVKKNYELISKYSQIVNNKNFYNRCFSCDPNCQYRDVEKHCIIEENVFLETATQYMQECEEAGIKPSQSIRDLIEQLGKLKIRILRAENYEGGMTFVQHRIGKGDWVNPVSYTYLPGLYKQYNKILGEIGLLPKQKQERERLLIVKRMKQRLLEMTSGNQKVEVDSVLETETEF